MTLIADIVATVAATPAPVLFLDSCILLDIVRATIRNKPGEVKFARLFLTAVLKAPKTIHFLIASPVQTEWKTHIVERENECTMAINACDAVSEICGHLGLPAVPVLPADVLDMTKKLREMSAACLTIDHNAAALGRAVDRIVACTHPVKQPHSKGAKDAVILEHAVETTAQLRASGFNGICVFVRSNTADFADPGSTNLHAQLVSAFNPVNLQYAVSLTHAESILTAAGWVP